MKMVHTMQPTHWMEKKAAEKSDKELFSMFEDIADFRKTGILASDSKLRELDREFCSVTNQSSMMRTTEDTVLFEICRRAYNNHKED